MRKKRTYRTGPGKDGRLSRQLCDVDSLPNNRLFSVKEAAQLFGIGEHELRYWERCTPLKPMRVNGSRRYDKEDLKLVERINYLVHVKGMTVQAAADHLQHPDLDVDLEVRDRLLRVRQQLCALRDQVGKTLQTTEPTTPGTESEETDHE
jgi:DNA-binding transcriptional MerR regulator